MPALWFVNQTCFAQMKCGSPGPIQNVGLISYPEAIPLSSGVRPNRVAIESAAWRVETFFPHQRNFNNGNIILMGCGNWHIIRLS